MHFHNNLPIMPKEIRASVSAHQAKTTPYPPSSEAGLRKAAIWNANDDEMLLQARAASLDWKSISRQHFPDKTSNACRKRHERLIERRQAEDWDSEKLENLAHEYMIVREEMWRQLAERVGEKWSIVEAKCMEKGLKNLQAAARSSQRRAASAGSPVGLYDEQAPLTDRNRDSGIEFGSDAEMDVDSVVGRFTKRLPSSWHASTSAQSPPYPEHTRSHSLPQLLPLYQPPPPPTLTTEQRRAFDGPMMISPASMIYPDRATTFQRYSPESQSGRGPVSIQSMLSPAEPQRA